MAQLLLIEDGEGVLGPILGPPVLTRSHWTCDRTTWGLVAFESLPKRRADVIIASALTSGSGPHEFFRWLREHSVRSRTIAVLPEDPAEEVLRDCLEVTDDFLLFPVRHEELHHRIARLLPRTTPDISVLRDKLAGELGLKNLIGQHPAFLKEIAKIPLAAGTESEVLITGETGTGKELCARAIHYLSKRRNHPMICVDCGAVPDQLFESEVFGHVRGAFTDAHRTHKGLVAMAEGGTLFLDEIDSLSIAAQGKLLRFLQDRSYRQVGAERFSRADVRVVAATNRDLERAVKDNIFRSDLYFRINVLPLYMVPLRERTDDIELLAEHFLTLCFAETGGVRKMLTPSSLHLLRSLEWPGNARELLNTIRRGVSFSDGARISPWHLFPGRLEAETAEGSISFRDARANAISAFERRYAEDLLRKHDGNITRAARDAGKDRRAFGRLVKRNGINPRGFH
jgi:DNA-binding NtrC family response regulator